jgi:hypothetical protein
MNEVVTLFCLYVKCYFVDEPLVKSYGQNKSTLDYPQLVFQPYTQATPNARDV